MTETTDTPDLSCIIGTNDHDNQTEIINPSKYYEIDTIDAFLNSLPKKYGLSIFNNNARSLLNSIEQYKYLFQLLKQDHNFSFDIIAFEETWLDKNNENLAHIPQYTPIFKHRTPCRGGGIAIFVKDDLRFSIRNDLNVPDHLLNLFDIVFIEVVVNSQVVIIAILYRSPSFNSIPQMQEFIEQTVGIINRERKQFILLGDFNINLLSYNKSRETTLFLDSLISLNLIPKITLPTRITQNSATIIDHVYSNMNNISAGTLITDITDHYSNIVTVNTNQEKLGTVPKYISYRPVNDSNLIKFRNALSNVDWSLVYNSEDPNEAYRIFLSIYKSVMDQTIPMKCAIFNKYRNKLNPWMTIGLMKSFRNKQKLYSKLNSCKCQVQYEVIKQRYIAYRNLYNILIRKSKKLYWSKKFTDAKNSVKQTWANINCLLNQSKDKSNFPDSFIQNNIEITNDRDIADSFNKYFVNVGPNLAKTIPACPNHELNLDGDYAHSFSITPTDPLEILNVIEKLKPKTSTGYDEISTKCVKETCLPIAEPLSHIMNLSFSQGKFPSDMKLAQIVPVFKSENKQYFNNYRPISLLPAFSKIAEKLMYNRLYKYLSIHNIISNSQYGFRKNISTDLAILELQNRVIENLSNGKTCIGVFLDLSKAFDTLDHNILLKKLAFYGVRGVAFEWFRSYLENRLQFTKYKSASSQRLEITCGIPQGSILGPLLFTLYINDLPKICNSCSPILFADDTNLLFSGRDLPTLINEINSQLNLLSQWFILNKLSLNVSKTKFILFTSQHNTPIPNRDLIINGEVIESVDSIKFLGVIIDKNFKWKEHISHKCNTIAKTLSVFTRIRHFIPTEILKVLYHSLITPHLTYGIVAWGMMDTKESKRLSILQKRAIRLMANCKYNAHTGPLFKLHNLYTIDDIFKIQCGKLLVNRLKSKLPQYLINLLPISDSTHSYNTRTPYIIRPHIINSSYRKQHLSYKLYNLYNELPDSLKNKISCSPHTFKRYQKRLYNSQYSSQCEIRNCYICQT